MLMKYLSHSNSPECQKESWKTHKKMCKVLKDARWAYTADLLPKLKD